MFPKTKPYSAYPYAGGAAYSTFNKRSPYGKCSSRPPHKSKIRFHKDVWAEQLRFLDYLYNDQRRRDMEIINEQNMRMLQRLHEMPPSIPPTLFNRAYEEKQQALKRAKRNKVRKLTPIRNPSYSPVKLHSQSGTIVSRKQRKTPSQEKEYMLFSENRLIGHYNQPCDVFIYEKLHLIDRENEAYTSDSIYILIQDMTGNEFTVNIPLAEVINICEDNEEIYEKVKDTKIGSDPDVYTSIAYAINFPNDMKGVADFADYILKKFDIIDGQLKIEGMSDIDNETMKGTSTPLEMEDVQDDTHHETQNEEGNNQQQEEHNKEEEEEEKKEDSKVVILPDTIVDIPETKDSEGQTDEGLEDVKKKESMKSDSTVALPEGMKQEDLDDMNFEYEDEKKQQKQDEEAQPSEEEQTEQPVEEEKQPVEEEKQPVEEPEPAVEVPETEEQPTEEEEPAEEEQPNEEPVEEVAAEEEVVVDEHEGEEATEEQPAEEEVTEEEQQPVEEQPTEEKEPATEEAEEAATEEEEQPVEEQPAVEEEQSVEEQPALEEQPTEEEVTETTVNEEPVEEQPTEEEEPATKKSEEPVTEEQQPVEEEQPALEEQPVEQQAVEEQPTEEEQQGEEQPTVEPVEEAATEEPSEEEQQPDVEPEPNEEEVDVEEETPGEENIVTAEEEVEVQPTNEEIPTEEQPVTEEEVAIDEHEGEEEPTPAEEEPTPAEEEPAPAEPAPEEQPAEENQMAVNDEDVDLTKTQTQPYVNHLQDTFKESTVDSFGSFSTNDFDDDETNNQEPPSLGNTQQTDQTDDFNDTFTSATSKPTSKSSLRRHAN